MAAMEALKVTPQQLKTKSGEFKKKASDVKRTTDDMLNEITKISAATWSGDAAEAFKKRFGELQDDMERIYKMIMEYSSDLDDIAQKYIETENSNEQIATSLAADIF